MNSAHKKLVVGVLLVVALAGSGVFLYQGYQPVVLGSIQEYVPHTDRDFALRTFNEHKPLLFVRKKPNIEHIFDTHSPNEYEKKYFGKMHIKVWRDGDKPAGIVTYYMETSYQGRILFLVVDSNFQGKGYGRKLVQYAMEQLKMMGAKTVKLFTLHENLRAQKLYESLGFISEGSDDYGIFYRQKI